MSEQTEKASHQSGDSASILLQGLKAGLVGIKSGMTQVYNPDGDLIPVTVIDLSSTVITQVKTIAKDGYNAVQVGFNPKKINRVNKADKGHFKKSGFPGFHYVKEFRVDSVDGLQVGQTLSIDFFKEGDLIDVTAVSKGKGFQGGMKRYNMSGNYKTHGASLSHRSLGSIGNRADPAKCFKNKKMPGQMGNEKVTILNLSVVNVDHENQLLLVRGSIPGPKNGYITLRKAIKHNG